MSPKSSSKGRILIVDDHPMLRYGLAQLINQQVDMTVCGEAEDVPGALQSLAELKPDVLIVDIALKGMDGIELIKRIRDREKAVGILVLSMHDEMLYAGRALRAGANGYVMKNESGGEVLAAIRVVRQGKIHVSERVSSRIVRQFAQGPDATGGSPIEGLTDRELQVFRLIGLGRGTREIARELHISGKTVEVHRIHIKTKLNLRSANELIRTAVHWVENEN
jgi:DNA-binding NarL/FixJ family response regulator